MDDVIYKQAAIDAKQEFRNPNVVRSTEARTAYDRAYANGWNDCDSAWIDVVKDLPPAQTEHNPDDERKIADLHKMVNYLLSQLEQRWITCRERPPEKNGVYIVSYENSVTCLEWFNGKWFFYPSNPAREETGTIIAWMPFPTPYQKEVDE